jgi:hypothetical protein
MDFRGINGILKEIKEKYRRNYIVFLYCILKDLESGKVQSLLKVENGKLESGGLERGSNVTDLCNNHN